MKTLLTLVILCATWIAQPAARAEQPRGGWTSDKFRDHPLVGTIWSFGKGAPVSLNNMITDLREADIILIGEIHDNLDHHQIQALILAKLVTTQLRPAIVWEMVPQSKQPILNAYNVKPIHDADQLGTALNWSKTGWPDWAIYKPIAGVAAKWNLPMFAGDANRSEIRKLGRNGINIFPPKVRKKLALDGALPGPLRKSLDVELKASHCDMMPDSGLAMMANVQRLRDGQLAESLLRARKASPTGHALLIAGSGHTRADRGVPWVLRRLAPGLKVLSIAAVEVSSDVKSASELVVTDPMGKPTADYIWITPVKSRPDPCEQLRKKMERIRTQRK